MKKILLVVSLMLAFSGCSLMASTPTKVTQDFLQRYKTLSEGVVSDLELSSEISGLTTSEHKTKYIDVMKRQYQDLKYEIVEEEIDGDEASVEVKISVYDMYKARREAEEYINTNETEFYKDNDVIRDIVKVNEYVLSNLYKNNERVEYTIDIELLKVDGKWEVQELDSITKEKLHGTYNYEA